MFEKMHGGTLVKAGTYFCLNEGEFVSIPVEGDYLPGTSNTTFIRTPLATVLLLGPILGLTFVIFLPLAVPLLVGTLIAQRLKRRAPDMRDAAVAIEALEPRASFECLPTAQPSDDHIITRTERNETTAADLDELEDLIAQLEKEVAERRTEMRK